MPLARRSKHHRNPAPQKEKKRVLPATAVPVGPRVTKATSFRVKTTSVSGIHRRMTVVGERGKETQLKVPRMSLVGPGDSIYLDPSNSSRLFVCSKDDIGDLIPVTPHFESRQRLRLGSIDYEIVIKEITTQADLDEYDYLEGFHYKTSSAIVTEESDPGKGKTAVGGRKGVLLAYIKVGNRMMPAGYIELQMPLLMVKPRHVLFAHGFSHPVRPVAWEKWDVNSMRQYVNLIVRIARVVVSPDLRGLGLARILISVAKEFAKERWQVGGRRPLFMEISAEMLKYMDFTTSAGLHFIGDTEGNLARIHKDLVHMRKGQKISFGMMTLQKKYLTQLQALAQQLGRTFCPRGACRRKDSYAP